MYHGHWRDFDQKHSAHVFLWQERRFRETVPHLSGTAFFTACMAASLNHTNFVSEAVVQGSE